MVKLSDVLTWNPQSNAMRACSIQRMILLVCLVLTLVPVPVLAASITGTIACMGEGVEGVVVSDGYAFTTTDKQGFYTLDSNKKYGYIFYVIPSGYMPLAGENDWEDRLFGGFWQTLTSPEDKDKDERHDFALQREENDNHIMVFAADPQLGNRKDTKDMKIYKKLFLPRIKREIEEAGSTPVYSTVLGDLSWDRYWYANHFNIADYKAYVVKNHKSYNMRHFCVMGNHDYDPATPYSGETDLLASALYRRTVGPTYYSYNIGKIHYVVLDDIIYENKPSKSGKYEKGIVGTRDYKAGLTDEQLAWLEKDLSYVDAGTPVFVSMHAPAWAENGHFEVVAQLKYNNTTARLCQMLGKFRTVHIMSGHRHQCCNMQPEQFPNIMEHTLGAVGGNLWSSSGYTGHPVCVDGSPGGYQTFTINGKDISWQSHILEGAGNEQMRVIDVNTLKELQRGDSTWQTILKTYPGRQDFSKMADNTILVNVFNYDNEWTVRVYEDGKELPVSRIRCEDPYVTMTFDIPMFKKEKTYRKGDATKYNTHTFLAVASKPDSKIRVEVTDRFGRTYHTTKQFPIACTLEALAPSGI